MPTLAAGRSLKVPSESEVRRDIEKQPEGMEVQPEVEKDLEQRAESYVRQLTQISDESAATQKPEVASVKASVETFARDLQTETAQKIQLLKEPIRKLSARSQEGGEVANALIDLKNQVEELDPARFNFEPGWFSRTVGLLPFVGTPMKRYFSQFESAQTVISSIVRSLEVGKEQLLRDNVTLIEDQRQMREMTQRLERTVRIGQLIDSKLQDHLSSELTLSEIKRRFIQEELLFPLRQRIIDLQQQLAVNQQGILAMEIIVRNNKELVRGVDRALSVTVTALHVAATVALALTHQRIVLDKITAVNQTTAELIAGTAARLRSQGVEIQKQATRAQIDMKTLRAAFSDIREALVDLSQYRKHALPEMAKTVDELNRVTSEAEASIQNIEKGNLRRPDILIEAA